MHRTHHDRFNPASISRYNRTIGRYNGTRQRTPRPDRLRQRRGRSGGGCCGHFMAMPSSLARSSAIVLTAGLFPLSLAKLGGDGPESRVGWCFSLPLRGHPTTLPLRILCWAVILRLNPLSPLLVSLRHIPKLFQGASRYPPSGIKQADIVKQRQRTRWSGNHLVSKGRPWSRKISPSVCRAFLTVSPCLSARDFGPKQPAQKREVSFSDRIGSERGFAASRTL